MTESEYKELRKIKEKLNTYRVKYHVDNTDFYDIQNSIRSMMDKYLYESYTNALKDQNYVDTVLNSTHKDFIEHMQKFVKDYEAGYM